MECFPPNNCDSSPSSEEDYNLYFLSHILLHFLKIILPCFASDRKYLDFLFRPGFFFRCFGFVVFHTKKEFKDDNLWLYLGYW